MLEMESIKRIVYILIAIVAIWNFWKNKDSVFPPPKLSFEKQLQTFYKLGFELNPGTSEDDIDRWGSKKEFEDEEYSLMYFTLGSTIEREPWTPLTNKALSLNFEIVSMPGVYKQILKDIQRISNGELDFQDIKDKLDFKNKKASVEFSVNNDHYHWDLKFNDDWLDLDLFTKIQELCKKYKTQGQLTRFDYQELDIVLGYYTEEELKQIKESTKLNIYKI